MQRIFSAGLLKLVLLALLLPVLTFAQESPPTTISDLASVLCRVADLIFVILIVIAAIFMVAAAVTFVTAGDDADKIKDARHRLIYALAGLVIAFIAIGLPWVIASAVMGGTGDIPDACELTLF